MALLPYVPLSALPVEDEADFAQVPLYARLKQALLDDNVRYRIPKAGTELGRWDHVLLLNLAFWTPEEPDDVLESRFLSADVVAHRAWHHLAHRALGSASRSIEGLMLGEAIASAFDVYLIGMLLRTCPGAAMLESQTVAMTEVMIAGGHSEQEALELFQSFSESPGQVFAELAQLLYEVGVALCRADGAEQAANVLCSVEERRVSPVLHHFQLASWVLYSKAYATHQKEGAMAAELAAELLGAQDPLAELARRWL